MNTSRNLGEFEQVVLLTILRLEDAGAYGVSIRAEIRTCTGRESTPGAIYATLERLESKGLVKSSAGEATPERGGRAKRYYRVTTRGLNALKRAQQAFRALASGLSALGETSA